MNPVAAALCALTIPSDAPVAPLPAAQCETLYAQAVAPEDFVRQGERVDVDAGPAIRRALASGRPVRFTRAYLVRPDPASLRGAPANAYWSIRVPSRAMLFFEPAARLVQSPGAGAWTRTVVFENATDFRVFGTLRVDANGARVDANHNEHMHGVMLYNARNFSIAAIDSRNARGDNVFIGGDDDTVGSARGYIGAITAVGAGRKNLVLHAFDELRIGRVDLDNTAGGAKLYSGTARRGVVVQPSAAVYATDTGTGMINPGAPRSVEGTTQAALEAQGFRVDDTDGHALDIEPDLFSGRVLSRVTIDAATMRGSGLDASAGITLPAATRLVATFGTLRMTLTPRRGVPPWLQYGAHIRVGTLTIDGLSADLAQSQILYASRLEVERATLNGAGTSPEFAILQNRVGSAVPVVSFGRLEGRLGGGGIEARNSNLSVGDWRLRTAGPALWVRGVADDPSVLAAVQIGTLDASGSGGSGGCNCTVRMSEEGGARARLSIGSLVSSSAPSTRTIVQVGRSAARAFRVARIDTPLAPTPVIVEP